MSLRVFVRPVHRKHTDTTILLPCVYLQASHTITSDADMRRFDSTDERLLLTVVEGSPPQAAPKKSKARVH